jgi:ethanolamine ammonia-lyase small subunit
VPNPKDEKALRQFRESTPARIGVWRAGDRPLIETVLRFRADHALAIDSVFSTVDEKLIDEMKLVKLQTEIRNKDEHITRPDLGRELNEESLKLLKEKCIQKPQVQIIVSDGLSSKAIEANIKNILSAFMQGLGVYNIKLGTPVFVKYGRVGVMDVIGEELHAEAAIMFIGERPGLVTAESMSAYMVYNPRRGLDEAERNVLSNIHKGGTPPVEAGAHIATLMKRILDAKASGINLQK